MQRTKYGVWIGWFLPYFVLWTLFLRLLPPDAFPARINRKVFVFMLIPLAVRLSRCSDRGFS